MYVCCGEVDTNALPTQTVGATFNRPYSRCLSRAVELVPGGSPPNCVGGFVQITVSAFLGPTGRLRDGLWAEVVLLPRQPSDRAIRQSLSMVMVAAAFSVSEPFQISDGSALHHRSGGVLYLSPSIVTDNQVVFTHGDTRHDIHLRRVLKIIIDIYPRSISTSLGVSQFNGMPGQYWVEGLLALLHVDILFCIRNRCLLSDPAFPSGFDEEQQRPLPIPLVCLQARDLLLRGVAPKRHEVTLLH